MAAPSGGTGGSGPTRQTSFGLKRNLSVDVCRSCTEVGESVWSEVDVDLGSVGADFRNADAVHSIAQNTGRYPDRMIWCKSARYRQLQGLIPPAGNGSAGNDPADCHGLADNRV